MENFTNPLPEAFYQFDRVELRRPCYTHQPQQISPENVYHIIRIDVIEDWPLRRAPSWYPSDYHSEMCACWIRMHHHIWHKFNSIKLFYPSYDNPKVFVRVLPPMLSAAKIIHIYQWIRKWTLNRGLQNTFILPAPVKAHFTIRGWSVSAPPWPVSAPLNM